MGAVTTIAGARVRWGRLLSEEDAAEYLGISRTTLRDLGIEAKPIGRRRLYDIRSLDRFADNLGGTAAPTGEGPKPEDVAAEEQRFFESRRKRGRAN